MSERNEEWVLSRDEAWFSGTFFDSREDAIAHAAEELGLPKGATFYVGRVRHLAKPITDATDVAETLLNETWDRYVDALRQEAGPEAPENADGIQPGLQQSALERIAAILTEVTPTPSIFAVEAPEKCYAQ